MTIRLHFVLATLLFSSSLFAQTDFRPGFVVKKTGDTLYGQIDYRGDLLMSSVCTFKNNASSIEQFTPDDLMSYRFIDGKYYTSRLVDNKSVFLEYLVKGIVSMYYIRDETADRYFIDKVDIPLTELPYDEGIRMVDFKNYESISNKHIGLLNYFMQDAPDFRERIQRIEKPEHRNLIKLAEDYHKAVCPSGDCITYIKDKSLFKIFPELILGVGRGRRVNDEIKPAFGVIGHIWLPRTSENLYLRTGIWYSPVAVPSYTKNFVKIPVQIEYIYPKGKFRPRVAYGLNLFPNLPKANVLNSRTVSLNLGGNLKIDEKRYISITTEFEFDPLSLIIPRTLIASYLNVGLFHVLK